MQRPKDLSREQLERIVDEVQQALYLDYDGEADAFHWNPDKEWSGFDVCEALTGALSQLGMIPEQRSPFT
jgi:hypothetical protein